LAVFVNSFFERRVQQLFELAGLVDKIFSSAGLEYRIAGGLAAHLCVEEIEPDAGRLTKDIGIHHLHRKHKAHNSHQSASSATPGLSQAGGRDLLVRMRSTIFACAHDCRSIWVAAVEMAQRYGLHRAAKALRLDYMRLKKRMPGGVAPAGPAPPAFLKLLGPAATGPAERVVEWESARGRMRVAMKGVTPDWTGLLRAWRES
jgi:hypothetical protein